MRKVDSAEVRKRTEFVHLTWLANPRQLASIRTQVRGWLAPLDLTEGSKEDLVLAVNEAVSNSVEHAYLPPTPGDTVELTFWTEFDTVCLEIVDHGSWRVSSGRSPGRGRGIEMMERILASVMIHYDARGTRVLLRHPLQGGSDRALHTAGGGA